MKQALQRFVFPCTTGPNPKYSTTSLSSISLLQPRFFGTNSENPDQSHPDSGSDPAPNKEYISTQVEDVSTQELKSQIQKYMEGDAEAIPSIFEAILKRKLAGKHDESDDELIKELGHGRADYVSEDLSEDDFSDDDISNDEVHDKDIKSDFDDF